MDTELFYFNARWHHPSTGRWLEADPVWDPNLYVFCDQNPANSTDSDGRFNDFTGFADASVCCTSIGNILGGPAFHCWIESGEEQWSLVAGGPGSSPGGSYGLGQTTQFGCTHPTHGDCTSADCPPLTEPLLKDCIQKKSPGRWWPWHTCVDVVNECLEKAGCETRVTERGGLQPPPFVEPITHPPNL